MVRKKFEDMEVGDKTMSEGVFWVVKKRVKDDTLSRLKKTTEMSETMLVNVDNQSQTWRPSPDTEFDVMTDVDEG
ncbi:MAG: hypothetical protein QG633_64 [Patescibacteria group bacterium]|jgi:hypothetical protein|nr:hypothetical protein [Patescibacteria group bacterium]